MTAVSGLILAGGRSSRFDGDKLASDLGGRTVLDRTIEVVQALADQVVVVGRAGASPGVVYIADDLPFQGPLVGLAAGLRAATGELLLAIAGDMPLAHSVVLRLLLDEVGLPDRPAAALRDAGVIRPLPLAARRDPARQAAEAALADGERSLRALLERLPAVAIEESTWRRLDPGADTLLDIDTPGDLARARARLRARRDRRA